MDSNSDTTFDILNSELNKFITDAVNDSGEQQHIAQLKYTYTSLAVRIMSELVRVKAAKTAMSEEELQKLMDADWDADCPHGQENKRLKQQNIALCQELKLSNQLNAVLTVQLTQTKRTVNLLDEDNNRLRGLLEKAQQSLDNNTSESNNKVQENKQQELTLAAKDAMNAEFKMLKPVNGKSDAQTRFNKLMFEIGECNENGEFALKPEQVQHLVMLASELSMDLQDTTESCTKLRTHISLLAAQCFKLNSHNIEKYKRITDQQHQINVLLQESKTQQALIETDADTIQKLREIQNELIQSARQSDANMVIAENREQSVTEENEKLKHEIAQRLAFNDDMIRNEFALVHESLQTIKTEVDVQTDHKRTLTRVEDENSRLTQEIYQLQRKLEEKHLYRVNRAEELREIEAVKSENKSINYKNDILVAKLKEINAKLVEANTKLGLLGAK
jgi:hypothetical protein